MKRIWYYLLVVTVLGLLFFASFKLLYAVSVVKCILGAGLLLLTSIGTLAFIIREILFTTLLRNEKGELFTRLLL